MYVNIIIMRYYMHGCSLRCNTDTQLCINMPSTDVDACGVPCLVGLKHIHMYVEHVPDDARSLGTTLSKLYYRCSIGSARADDDDTL